METAESRPAVKSADRVLDLFEALSHWGKPLSHTELAEQLGIPKSSLTQLLQTLVSRGYLAFAPGSRNYQLGPSLAALAHKQTGARNLVDLARPVLAELTLACRESSALYVLRGDEAVAVATVLGPQRLVSHMREGDASPLYATSGGKVLLSFLPAGMREEYLGRVKLRRILPNTLHTESALRREIESVRAVGAAFVEEEFTQGIVGISVPVHGTADEPGNVAALGALNVAVPKARYTDGMRDDILSLLRRAATRLENALGWPQ